MKRRLLPDRREAIQEALSAAAPGDYVVIAGKGHESVQKVGNAVIDFDDRRARARGVAFIGTRWMSWEAWHSEEDLLLVKFFNGRKAGLLASLILAGNPPGFLQIQEPSGKRISSWPSKGLTTMATSLFEQAFQCGACGAIVDRSWGEEQGKSAAAGLWFWSNRL